jgi:hypothetical protein
VLNYKRNAHLPSSAFKLLGVTGRCRVANNNSAFPFVTLSLILPPLGGGEGEC